MCCFFDWNTCFNLVKTGMKKTRANRWPATQVSQVCPLFTKTKLKFGGLRLRLLFVSGFFSKQFPDPESVSPDVQWMIVARCMHTPIRVYNRQQAQKRPAFTPGNPKASGYRTNCFEPRCIEHIKREWSTRKCRIRVDYAVSGKIGWRYDDRRTRSRQKESVMPDSRLSEIFPILRIHNENGGIRW